MITEIASQVAQFSKNEVLELLERVQSIFQKELRLIKLPDVPLLFVGDTHGDWEATQTILKRYWETPTVFVFLGDYVDRGPCQIENINLLLELKTRAPQRLVLLRGNHEIPSINRAYGFYNTLLDQLGDITNQYWTTFANLPLAAISRSQRIFAVHGGISEGLKDLEQIIKTLKKPNVAPFNFSGMTRTRV